MIGVLARFFPRRAPVVAAALPHDASAIAMLHAVSFRRGWSEEEVESLLIDRAVTAHRIGTGRALLGFVMSRQAADEAEILSIAIARRAQGRGLARQLLDMHLRRLAASSVRTVFLEVDEHNMPAIKLYQGCGFSEIARRTNYYPGPGATTAAALVLRRDIA